MNSLLGKVVFVLTLTTFIVFGPAMLAPLVFAIGVDKVIVAAFGCFAFAAVDWALDPWRARRARAGVAA